MALGRGLSALGRPVPQRRDDLRLRGHAARRDDALRGTIQRYGWALQYVLHDDPDRSFGYTVGLHLHDLPEIVAVHLAPEEAWPVLNDVAGRSTADHDVVRAGAVLTDVVAGIALQVQEVEDTRALTRVHDVAPRPADVRAVRLVPRPRS